MPVCRISPALSDIAPAQWDALHGSHNPFVSHAFLSGLEQHGCLRAEWGWTPHHLTLWDGEELVGAAPGYLKANSHGEFVFDHAWAHAYARHGLDYYPKWLGAVPYTPATGPRLLARVETHDPCQFGERIVVLEVNLVGGVGMVSVCHSLSRTRRDFGRHGRRARFGPTSAMWAKGDRKVPENLAHFGGRLSPDERQARRQDIRNGLHQP